MSDLTKADQVVILEALQATKRLINEALPKFNWGASALDANAITLLNETPDKIERALLIFSTHECIQCHHRYAPLPKESEDCPICGCDGV